LIRFLRANGPLWKQVALYGALLAAMALILQWLDYQRLARTRWDEVYAVAIAFAFLALGIFVGARAFAGARKPAAFDGNPQARATLGISARELAVLQEIVAGRSNKEIAARLHIAPTRTGALTAKPSGRSGQNHPFGRLRCEARTPPMDTPTTEERFPCCARS